MITFTPSRSATTYVCAAGGREISGFFFSNIPDLWYSYNELKSSTEMQHIKEHGNGMPQIASRNEDA